jgi:hypothetical protein
MGMAESQFVSLDYREYPAEEMQQRAAVFYADVRRRRSVRQFSARPVPAGVLIAATHHAGLVSLPYTPSRMGFLSEVLERPKNERPFLLLAVGYPAEGAVVPGIHKKSLEEIATFI